MGDAEQTERVFDRGNDLSARGARALAAGREQEGRACFRSAINAYKQALAAAPTGDPLTVANLNLCIGARWFGLGEWARALRRIEDAIGLLLGAPDLVESGDGRGLLLQARLNRAECWIAQGELARARLEIDDVLASEPEQPYGVMLLDTIDSDNPT